MTIQCTPPADRDQVVAELDLAETFGPLKPTLSDELAVEILAEEIEFGEFEGGAEDFEL